jgi:hypothetical protein
MKSTACSHAVDAVFIIDIVVVANSYHVDTRGYLRA